jgi:hypothetical protein
MGRLPRPHIPLDVRCRVALRQLGEMWPDTLMVVAKNNGGFGSLLRDLLSRLGQLLSDDEATQLHLDHDPPLGAREKVFRGGVHVGYGPMPTIRSICSTGRPARTGSRPTSGVTAPSIRTGCSSRSSGGWSAARSRSGPAASKSRRSKPSGHPGRSAGGNEKGLRGDCPEARSSKRGAEESSRRKFPGGP